MKLDKLVDYFIYVDGDDDESFNEFCIRNLNNLDFINKNHKLIGKYDKEKYYVREGVFWWKEKLLDIDELKLLDYPPSILFINDKISKNISDLEFTNKNIIYLPNDFNLNNYKRINKLNISKIEIIEHYLKYRLDYKIPIKNKNNLPPFFNILAVKCFYPTLQNKTNDEIIDFYKKNKNNIKYSFQNVPYDFDPEKYIEINKFSRPLKNIYEAYFHYEKTGFYQGRKYK